MFKKYAEHLDGWVEAVGNVTSVNDTEGLKAVDAKYYESGILVPTIENNARCTSEERIAYFKAFAPDVTGASWCEPTVMRDEKLGKVMISGTYFFLKGGAIASAEYDFEFDDRVGVSIVHHTSRKHPEGCKDTVPDASQLDTETTKSKLADWF